MLGSLNWDLILHVFLYYLILNLNGSTASRDFPEALEENRSPLSLQQPPPSSPSFRIRVTPYEAPNQASNYSQSKRVTDRIWKKQMSPYSRIGHWSIHDHSFLPAKRRLLRNRSGFLCYHQLTKFFAEVWHLPYSHLARWSIFFHHLATYRCILLHTLT